MQIDVLTLFPEMFAPLGYSIMKNAQDQGHLTFNTHNFREFAVNKHGHVDDYPYGGGAGMLLRVEPIVEQLEKIQQSENTRVVLVDPTGVPFTQELAKEWSQEEQIVFICGHYEGFDQRVREFVTDEVSVGDYVLTNGELPAMVMIDATVRLIPEVVGNEESIVQESYSESLLEYPQYTRPREFRGMAVPDILLSGDHAKIDEWRRQQALLNTKKRRPDLIEQADLTESELEWLNNQEI
ncbi:tRNA (guanosine(37)-N1)-methyltransferase TrmD [Aerococcaceae bacterium DSM 111176]|nr:tRNA (guanosine(37)-N1)-methyltransferase TrmD [Aerococcaceae bacterium DSM 111176]